MMAALDSDVEWMVSADLTEYPNALQLMEARAAAIAKGDAPELVWLLEHPPLYTAGTSAHPTEMVDPRFPVFDAGRGGRYTYHGPGQRVGYILLDLKKRGPDVRAFVHALEGWVIDALALLGVAAWRAEGRVGIWTKGPDGREAKIGAIGVRVRRWVTYHGFAINVAPDLSHFAGIIPCGITEFGVTSLAQLIKTAEMTTLDDALRRSFPSFLATLADSNKKT